MATYYARKAGNINATDVWATTPSGTAGAQTFVAGDVLVSNSFAITVNVSTNLGSTGEVRNDTTGGATAGGSFSLSNGVTLTANVFAGSAACVTLAGTVSATVVGNITGGNASNASGISMGSTGTLSITGSLTAGTVSGSAHGVNVSALGVVNVTGDLTGSPTVNNSAMNIAAAATVNITGNIFAGNSGYGVTLGAAAIVNVTGTVTGGGSSVIPGLLCSVGAQVVTIIGTAIGAVGAGAVNNTAGSLSVTRAKGGPLATSNAGAVNSGTAGGSLIVEEIEYGDLGASPTSGPIRLTDKSSNVAVMYRFGTTKKTLVDANASGLMPAASNVRSGTVYNGGNSTGTCAVPAASSVAFGVPVDNTTGTAALTPAAVWDYLTASATTSGSMGERLKNAATVASVGQALSDALTP